MMKLSNKQLEKYINEILECDAFELHSDNLSTHNSDNPIKNYYIPYMMNDALECYLLLKNCRMTGKYHPAFKGTITAKFVQYPADIPNDELLKDTAKPNDAQVSSAVIFRQGTENVFTIWFEEAFRILQCFRYDRIGHFWVKGEEHWRRLVYIIGTIYDKYEYMGDQVCNEKEMALLPLMEFAPFRMYSPIHESLDSYYSESLEGLKCMTGLAAEAKDKKFLHLLKLYQLFPTGHVKNILFKSLNHPDRQTLYELIFHKVLEASMEYPERFYHPSLNAEISAARNTVTKQLHQAGFHGEYPLFHKHSQQLLAMEEHPFTILEAKDFSFRIQFMVSETATPKTNSYLMPLNAGFFKKRGNHSRIASSLKHL